MRALTAQQSATLSAEPGYGSFVRVLVQRGSEWFNLSALGPPSLDFLQEVEVSESIEAPVATATVRCAREVHGFSLAPLVTTSAINRLGASYAPLLAEGARFEVQTAVCPLGMQPSEAEWLSSFLGRIDSVDVGGDGISFEGRDYLGGLLQDSYIEVERDYGTGDPMHGDPVQNVMDVLIRDNTTLGLGTLYTPTSPAWNVGHFLQRGESLMEALSALATQLGWEVRYKWSSVAGAFRLTFWSPNRTATVPVRVFTAREYQSLSQVRTSLEDVRNVVEVVYSDTADLDVAGSPKRKTASAQDTSSIAAVERRFMRVAEDSTSNINTAAEALRLAQAAIADLAVPPLGVEMEVDFHPELELGDLVGVEGNGYHFTAIQTGAVRTLTHSFNASGATTKLTVLGKPSTSVRRWLSMEQHPTTAPASPFTGPSAPSGLSYVTTVGGFRLSFQPPTTGPKATSYEIHVSTSSGFAPSDSTRRVVGDLTEVSLTDLEPGRTYYAKVVARDSKGNRSAPSSEVAMTPLYVQPRLLQPYVQQGSVVPNDSFEACNVADAPPDTWTLLNGTWGTTAARIADSFSGSSAVHLNGGTLNTLASQYVTVRPGDLYSVEAWAKRTSATGSNVASLLLDYVDGAFTVLTAVSVLLNPLPADGWKRFYNVGTAPTGTRYLRVRINQPDTTPDDLLVDAVRVVLTRFLLEPLNLVGSSSATFANGFANVNAYLGQYTVAAFYKGADDTVFVEGRVTRAAGAPSAGTAIISGLPAGYRPRAEVTQIVATSTGPGGVTVTPAGSVLYQSGGVGWLSLDGVRFRGSP